MAPFGATYLWMRYNEALLKNEVKRQIISGLSRDKLTLLKFTKEESLTRLNWQHSNEFEFNNQMFDVVETETCGDVIIYWCWSDKKETDFNIKMNKLLAKAIGNDQQNKEKQQRLNNFFKSLYFSHNQILLVAEVHDNLEISAFSFIYHSVNFPPPVPPPEIV